MNYTNIIAIPKQGLVYGDTKKAVNDSHLFRNIKNKEVIVTNITSYVEAIETINFGYYAGFKSDHFGHFLLEGLSRLYHINKSNQQDIIWLTCMGSRKFTSWQVEILKLLGLDKLNHIIINKPTLIKKIEIVEPGYIISNLFTKKHNNFLSIYKKNILAKTKLWLSRSNIEGGWINEIEIEKILKKNGWEIFSPEKYSVKEQLEKIMSSEIVAGIEGSAFHILILGLNPKCEIIMFSRGSQGIINDNYTLIANTKNFKQTVYHPEQLYLDGKGLKSQFVVNPNQVLNRLKIKETVKFDYYKILDKEHKKNSSIQKPENLKECIDLLFLCSIYLDKNTKFKDEVLSIMKFLRKLRPDGKMILYTLKRLENETKS